MGGHSGDDASFDKQRRSGLISAVTILVGAPSRRELFGFFCVSSFKSLREGQLAQAGLREVNAFTFDNSHLAADSRYSPGEWRDTAMKSIMVRSMTWLAITAIALVLFGLAQSLELLMA